MRETGVDVEAPGTFLGFDRDGLLRLGAALAGGGIVIMLIGVSLLSSVNISTPRSAAQSTLGIAVAFLFVGFTLLGFGAGAIRYSLVRPVTKYVAAEVAPGAEHLSAAIASGLRKGLAGVSLGERVVKVKCRNCGYLESEDAKFCSNCSQPM